MTKYITVKLTEDQADAIVRILDFGKEDPQEIWVESRGEYVQRYTPANKAFNAFIERIQVKIEKLLAEAKKL